MTQQRMLLVEGRDDQRVLQRISDYHNIHLPEVKPCGGKDALLDLIPLYVSRFSDKGAVLGVVVDADTSLESRWQSVRARFMNAGYLNAPEHPLPEGTILQPLDEPFLPKAGIWIMPNNRISGILEDFLHFLVPQPNPQWEHANACVNSVPDPPFRSIDKPKALIHTWLAWQKIPGQPLGTAITTRFLDPNVSEARVLAAWLRELFG